MPRGSLEAAKGPQARRRRPAQPPRRGVSRPTGRNGPRRPLRRPYASSYTSSTYSTDLPSISASYNSSISSSISSGSYYSGSKNQVPPPRLASRQIEP